MAAEIVSAEIVLRELLQDTMRSLVEKEAGHAEILTAAAYEAAFKDFFAGRVFPPPVFPPTVSRGSGCVV